MTIKLVAGDTRPQVVISLKTPAGVAIDLTAASLKLYFRKTGSSTVLATLNGTLITGFENPDGSLTTTAPYNVAGAGGRASFAWPPGSLDIEAGAYEGEVEITFPDSTVQTVFELLKFKVRSDFT